MKKYIRNIEKQIIGESNSGNSLEHEFHEIYKELEQKEFIQKNYSAFYNHLQLYPEFKKDWIGALAVICHHLNIEYNISLKEDIIFFSKGEK